MGEVLTANLLVDGLRTEFVDTYNAIRNRQVNSLLAKVMDLTIPARNRTHQFAYPEAAPHARYWRRGEGIPEDGMGSVKFPGVVHNFGLRIRWHADDRADDQTQSLYDAARGGGESFGLLPERAFFEMLTGTLDGTTLPAVPTAPDGAAFFATTAGGVARFGATGGNLLTGTGVATASAVKTDYYSVIKQFGAFKDRSSGGQPLLTKDVIDAGIIIVHANADLDVFEEAFLQKRQGVVKGTDAGTTPSNIVQDASRNVILWPTSRLATGDWYAFLANPPKKATFKMNRKALNERTSFEGDNNGDHTRDTNQEYIQWDAREGYGIALPLSAIKVNN